MSECASYNIIKMRSCMCLNASENALYDIINMRGGMCLNALNTLLLK